MLSELRQVPTEWGSVDLRLLAFVRVSSDTEGMKAMAETHERERHGQM